MNRCLHCCIITHYSKIHCLSRQSGEGWWLPKCIAGCKSRQPCAEIITILRWMVKRGLFKREMDSGSDLGTNIPLQRAHDSVSICTSLSFTLIHHSLTASTSCFHLTSHYPHLFLPNLSQTDAQMGFSSFLSTQNVIHLSWRSISCRCIFREHTGRGACAYIGRPWVDVSVRQ